MLAIPVLRSRVAPVLNWCSRIQIFPAQPARESLTQEMLLPHLDAGQRLQVLQDHGVRILICGALSADLLHRAGDLGLTVVSGVAGEVEEVVQSYWQNSLDQPKFRLPGCRGARHYRGGIRQGPDRLCQGQAKGGGRRGTNRSKGTRAAGPGPGGLCRCPSCSLQVPHEQGIPCSQVRCPRCGQLMERS